MQTLLPSMQGSFGPRYQRKALRPSCSNSSQYRRSHIPMNRPPARHTVVCGDGDGNGNGGPVSATQFLRKHMLDLKPYTPILPFEVLSESLGRKPSEIVKLDANENPYGPPPEVLQALGSLDFPHIYPDPECRELRNALGTDCGVPTENLLVGCGADELIDLLMRCVLEPGEYIVDCPPTFTMYAFDADVNNARVVTVPRKAGFQLDMDGIKAAVAEYKPKIVFLTSPNNPDGSVITEEELLECLSLPVLVVLDEAYIEFSEEPSRISWVKEYPNLVVLRTFSKRAGLAGLRIGYGGFHADLIEYLWRAKQPYNVSVAAEKAGVAALTNKKYLDDVKNALVSERERMYAALCKVPFLEPYPSKANFVLCKVLEDSGIDAKDLKDKLAEQGIMVRHYNKKILSGYVRISVGKPEQTDLMLAALESIVKSVAAA
mmetsp:Transcript_9727/g.35623  ORF Transcript_9727/g.35623 Transcript_9727/m.35623 type:complete len:432 (-) Transcript_9727:141-1436(-)